jgi:polysaccharide deacetylase family sporulation protein PdaB
MSPRIPSYRFPYFFIGLALAVAIFYRSPQGRGIQTGGGISPAEAADRRAAISPDFPAVRIPANPTEPVISAPSRTRLTDASSVSLPAVRKASIPESSRAAATRSPEVPAPAKEKIYLPDSYTDAIPVTPPSDQVHPESGLPLKVRIVSHGNESLNQVALTFDDGPNRKHTPQILDILRQYNVKGTFFVLGEQVRENPAMLKRIAEEGHEIGNHTFSHPQLKKLSDEKVREQIVSTQEEIRAVLGFAPKLLRPPYGAYKKASLSLFEELGLHVILWSVDTNDWRRKGDVIARTVSRDSKNGSIILFHDSKTETVRVLPQIIEELKGRGLQPVTISELTGIPAYDTVSPVVKTSPPVGQSGS